LNKRANSQLQADTAGENCELSPNQLPAAKQLAESSYRARPDAILRLVIRQALILAALGVSIGLIGAFALTRVMSSLLFGVSATDLLTFVITSLLLGSIALMASYIPARRAAKVDPIAALQHD
jgi:hypothetical protein